MASNAKYLKDLNSGEAITFKESATKSDRVNDMILVGLRTSEGLNKNHLLKYDVTPDPGLIEKFRKEGFLKEDKEFLRLTNKGKLFADQVAMEFFVDKDI